MNKQQTWVIASNNAGKIREINNLLEPKNIVLKSQSSLNISEVPETATTFVENALIKARHACYEANLPALADDSGLVVPCLNGEPGIYSARYAGTNKSSDNIKKLITMLSNIAIEQPIKAYFYCIVVLLRHRDDPTPIIAEGKWHGEITLTPHGENGFGYDPVFFDPELKITAAQMTLEQKQARSHRGIALRALSMALDK